MTFTWTARELTDEQGEAVKEEQSVFILACPGSGKTRAITYKIAYELSRLASRKKYVVAITYTNRAADEIHDRVAALGVETDRLWIGTIHAFCLDWILRPYGLYETDLSLGYTILDPYQQEQLIESLCAEVGGIKIWDFSFYATNDGYSVTTRLPEKRPAAEAVFRRYQRILRSNRQLDFEGILFYTAKLIRDRAEIASILGLTFEWLLVDEYQDTKTVQYSIVASIIAAAAGSSKFFIVGDPNQAIFDSLGGLAMPPGQFQAMCGVPMTVKGLTGNYRSTSRVVNFCHNFSLNGAEVHAVSDIRDEPSLICYDYSTTKEHLEEKLVSLVLYCAETLQIPPSRMCIVAPQWQLLASMTRSLVSALPQYDFDGPGLVPFSRNLDNFWFKLSRIALTRASPEMYIRRKRWASEVIRDLTVAGIDTTAIDTRRLLRESNAVEIEEEDGLTYLQRYFDAFFERLCIDVSAFQEIAVQREAFFTSSADRIQRLRDGGSDFISNVAFFRKVFRPTTGISVNTIHGVKGAEFDAVIAYGLLEGMVPNFNEPNRSNAAKKLLYVTASRSRRYIFLISEANRRNRGGPYLATGELRRLAYKYDVI
jgi:superfamily I DNA/RNA helicase